MPEHDHDHNHEASPSGAHVHEHSERGWLPLVISTVTMVLGLGFRYFQGQSLVSDLMLVSTMILSGYTIAELGLRTLIRGRININLLITIASIGAFTIGHLEEAAAVVLLFNIAERLEDYAADRARHSIESLMELKPENATLRRDGRR